jgi:hypothetical protein
MAVATKAALGPKPRDRQKFLETEDAESSPGQGSRAK